ncbi:BNR-4 repeat-containing protein [Spirillospora sp. NPDC046719]
MALGAGLAVPQSAGADAVSPAATRLGDRVLDPAARGNITYNGTANVGSYQQDGLMTYSGYQYVAWYAADRTAVISRRKLPSGDWQSIRLDAVLFADDSHNNIAMAVSPTDGRIHLALATHVPMARYIRSVPGLADGKAQWSSRSFEPVAAALPGAPTAPDWWTYPQFERVKGELLLTWRDGTSLGGGQALARYDADKAGTWTYLGTFSSPEGTYSSRFGSSNARYGYLHGFGANPVTGDLEITWAWREDATAQDPRCPGAAANRDLGYARSTDGGRTWKNNAGEVIGRTGTDDVITADDAQVVVEIPINQGMINQETQAFDSGGRIHVVTSQLNDEDLAAIGGCLTDYYAQRAGYAHPVHHWRDGDGKWHSTMLPFTTGTGGRSKLVFGAENTAYLVLPDGRIAAATAKSRWSDWKIVFAGDVDSISEVTIDRQRLRYDGVLSVAYQETGRPANAPSAFRVADFALGRRHSRPAAKTTTPEASPRPYIGSATVVPGIRASSGQPNFPAQFAADGKTNTYWSSGQEVNRTKDGIPWVEILDAVSAKNGAATPDRPQILSIDYGKKRWVNNVTVTPVGAKGPKTYTLQGRVNGFWKRLATVPAQAATALSVPVARSRIDAIRLVITAGNNADTVQIAEVTTLDR